MNSLQFCIIILIGVNTYIKLCKPNILMFIYMDKTKELEYSKFIKHNNFQRVIFLVFKLYSIEPNSPIVEHGPAERVKPNSYLSTAATPSYNILITQQELYQ